MRRHIGVRERLAALAAFCATGIAAAALAGPSSWETLEPGFELGRFDSRSRQAAANGDLVILRVDPQRWDLRVLQAGPATDDRNLTLAEWGEGFGLSAAINAGMYQADRRTHVGFAQIDGVVTNSGVNDYQSAVAFDPVDPQDDPYGIFDLDEVALGELRTRYRTVLQNLRLVKRPRENRWQPLGSRWAEAALGEDGGGRALLMYCSTAWSMQEFNEILLALPIGLVAAQHLEGRSQARLWVRDLPGGDRPGRLPTSGVGGPDLPNVIGVLPAETRQSARPGPTR